MRLTPILLVVLASTLIGCAALDAVTPVSQSEMEEMLGAQRRDTDASVAAAAEGDYITAITSGLGAIAAGVLLSRRRRRKQLAADLLAKETATS